MTAIRPQDAPHFTVNDDPRDHDPREPAHDHAIDGTGERHVYPLVRIPRTPAPLDWRPVPDPAPSYRHAVTVQRADWTCTTAGCGTMGHGATPADARRAADEHADPIIRRREHERTARFYARVADDSRAYAPLLRALDAVDLRAEVAHTGGGCLAVYVTRSTPRFTTPWPDTAHPFLVITDLDGPWELGLYPSLDASYGTNVRHASATLARDMRLRYVAAIARTMIDCYVAGMGEVEE